MSSSSTKGGAKGGAASEAPRRLEYLPVNELIPNPRNPKAHDTEVIDSSVGRFGYVEPVVLDGRTGMLISGHGRSQVLRSMQDRGETPPEGVQVDDAGQWLIPVSVGWASRTDSEANAALIAMNRTTELGGWVDDELLSILDDMDGIENGLDGLGYDEESIEALRDSLEAIGDGDSEDGESDEDRTAGHAEDIGTHLTALDVTWGEPEHEVEHGDVWRVGSHILVVARLGDEHGAWSGYLPGRRLCPYPEPYLSLSTVAEGEELLMVQPVKFLAGHLLDAHASVHGDGSVVKVTRRALSEEELEPEDVEDPAELTEELELDGVSR